MDMHVHRVGRTGRAGDKDGTAYTLITHKEAWFAGELANSLVAAGQNVSIELMDLAMKDGKFRSKRDARRGGNKRAKGRGGGGNHGVCVVEFGLGIGYNAEPKNTPSHIVPSHSAAVNSLKTGIKAQFQSSFVAASSGSLDAGLSSSSGMHASKKVLRGFVSDGSIRGGIYTAQASSSVNPSPVQSGTTGSQNRENASQKNPESSKERTRERRRPSGWDR